MLSQLINLAKTVAAAVLPGTSEAIAAGEAVLDLIKTVRPTLSATDQTALDAALPDLLNKMNANVDQALKDLRGT